MKSSATRMAPLILGTISVWPLFTPAQTKTDTGATAPSDLKADYPKNQAGVLLQSSGWTTIPGVMPSKTRVKHGVAASLSYGAVRAGAVVEYSGSHAQVQIETHRPAICICHVISLPGAPALVRLHAKKDFRELDGGRLPVLGSKITEASQNDLIPIEVSQPESSVWLVRPREALPAGEYALMLGTQNINIFPFTVSGAP